MSALLNTTQVHRKFPSFQFQEVFYKLKTFRLSYYLIQNILSLHLYSADTLNQEVFLCNRQYPMHTVNHFRLDSPGVLRFSTVLNQKLLKEQASFLNRFQMTRQFPVSLPFYRLKHIQHSSYNQVVTR